MINGFQKKVLLLAVRAGELMMMSGAEIYRVEDTITRICKAGKMSQVDVFATPTGIFVTMDPGDGSDVLSYNKRIKGGEMDLMKISRLNAFSREFASTDLSVDDGMEILDEIEGLKKYRLPVRLVAAALVAGFFCALFGGSTKDLFLAMPVGFFSYGFSRFLNRFDTHLFIRSFCSCALASFLALLLQGVGLADSSSHIIIGTLMIFVPGFAITNGIRDIFSGDMLSGLSRLLEAIVISVSLAAGAGIILKLWSMMGGIL